MTVLVTGAAGFIGYHVTRALLLRGERVLGIDNLNSYYDPKLKEARVAELTGLNDVDFRFVKADFADHEALGDAVGRHEIDRIVHLGAQAGVRYSLDNPRAYVESNLAGHLNMLEVARRCRPAHFVYASSSSVYGNSSALPLRVEDRVDHPISLYAATKKADELMSEAYAHLYRLPLTGLRFFTVYGPWGRPDMAMWIFTRKILRGEPIQLFNQGRMRRDFTYVDDVVAGVLSCLDSPPVDDGTTNPGGSTAPHRVYNIGNNKAEELTRLVSLLEEACGRPAQVDLQPMQPGDVVETCADLTAIQRDFGFRPQTTLDEGVPLFVQWFRSHAPGR